MIQKKQTKKIGISAGKVVAIGAGVAALGAGAYYLLGPDGKKNQKQAKAWMVKMGKEAEGKMKKMKNETKAVYHEAVDAIAQNYSEKYREFAPEIKSFAKQLKSGWKGVESKTKPVIKEVKKEVKKTIKTAKKITKKI